MNVLPAGRAVSEFAERSEARRARAAVAPFAGGYLLVWAAFGLAAAAALAGGRAAGVHLDRAAVAAGVLLAAALYELSPAKDACLRRCRHPLGLVVTHWRPGPIGATRMGALLGGWCAGCCWALMAGLLALGAMGVGWMLLFAAIVAAEKLLPWKQRAVTGAVASALVALAVVQVVA